MNMGSNNTFCQLHCVIILTAPISENLDPGQRKGMDPGYRLRNQQISTVLQVQTESEVNGSRVMDD